MAHFERPTLLHNPRCSKSRAAKVLLDEKGFSYRERRYLDEPLTLAELCELAKCLARPAREWVRSGEPEFRIAKLDENASEAAILEAMARYPVLIERPILVVAPHAVVGRPPERVLDWVT